METLCHGITYCICWWYVPDLFYILSHLLWGAMLATSCKCPESRAGIANTLYHCSPLLTDCRSLRGYNEHTLQVMVPARALFTSSCPHAKLCVCMCMHPTLQASRPMCAHQDQNLTLWLHRHMFRHMPPRCVPQQCESSLNIQQLLTCTQWIHTHFPGTSYYKWALLKQSCKRSGPWNDWYT